MSRDDEFLRAILASPGDEVLRLVYADWLAERGDQRAEVLRTQVEIGRRTREKEPTVGLQDRLDGLVPAIDPVWLSFMTTLGQPLRPSFLSRLQQEVSATASPELPFTEPLAARGPIVTFQSAFRDGNAWDRGLMDDGDFLRHLHLGDCYYGSASCAMHPFLCEVENNQRTMTAADVLKALKARDFRSQHIPSLHATTIPFPGYHPGTKNDEIHTDFGEQYLFRRPGDAEGSTAVEGSDAEATDTHRALLRRVEDQRLWYVALHAFPFGEGVSGRPFYIYVILFAVGKSRQGNRLLGVVSHQACHNLCD